MCAESYDTMYYVLYIYCYIFQDVFFMLVLWYIYVVQVLILKE